MFPIMQFFEVSVKVLIHPEFATSQGHVFASFKFELNESLAEKVVGEDGFALKLEAFGVGFDKNDLNLSELVVDETGQIESLGEANVVGVYFSEGLDLCYSLNSFDARGDDVLFFVGCLLGGGLFGSDRND